MRKTIIAGNWKLNKTSKEAVELVTELKRQVADVDGVTIVVCPPFTALTEVGDVVLESNIDLGAQNCFWENSGAFTGEISAPMLKALNCKYVIVGHSERRQFFGETNETVNRRLKAVLAQGLQAIVCVGENLSERESDNTFDVIKDHLTGSLAGISREQMASIVIAYEPVWAIGTGKTASPEQAQEVHAFIRGVLQNLFDDTVAQATTIQYGGSVKAENIAELIAKPDIDGALVGGASLQADSFAGIVTGAATTHKV